MRTRWLRLFVLVVGEVAATLALAMTPPGRAQEAPRYAGPTEKGFLLPNGWTLQPAGQHIALTDLPLNIISLADNRRVLVATTVTTPTSSH